MKVALLRLGLLAALLAVWELAGRAANPLLAVPPSAVLPALRELLLLRSYPDLPASLWLTVREIATAYALAVAAGLATGLALGMYRLAGRAFGIEDDLEALLANQSEILGKDQKTLRFR